MKKDILFTIGGKNCHLPKLIGAFIVFGAVLMLFQAVAGMYDVWDTLKDHPNCIAAVSAPVEGETGLMANAQVTLYKECKEILYRKTGIQLLASQVNPTPRQIWIALIGPVVVIFFWAIVFFLGIMLYNTGKIIIPVEHKAAEKKKRRRR